jgi:hypothetical protein
MGAEPRVAEGLLLSLLVAEPWYISLLRLTVGVASRVVFCNFWHLAQTISRSGVRSVSLCFSGLNRKIRNTQDAQRQASDAKLFINYD